MSERAPLLIVGVQPVANAPGHQGGPAFVGTSSGENLARYAGLSSSRQLPAYADLVNLWDDPWHVDYTSRAVYEAGNRVHELATRYDRVLALGAAPQRALCSPTRPREHMTWRVPVEAPALGRVYHVASLAHPSGLTRAWNNPDYRRRAREFLGDLFATSRPL